MSLAAAREIADRQFEKRLGEEYLQHLAKYCNDSNFEHRAPETESIEIADGKAGDSKSLVRYLSVGTDLSSAARIYVDDTLEFENFENFEENYKTAEDYFAGQSRKEKFWKVAGINSDAADSPIYLRLRQLEIVPCVVLQNFHSEKRRDRHRSRFATSRKVINDLRPGNKYMLVPTTALAFVVAVNKIPYGNWERSERRRKFKQKKRSSRSRSPEARRKAK